MKKKNDNTFLGNYEDLFKRYRRKPKGINLGDKMILPDGTKAIFCKAATDIEVGFIDKQGNRITAFIPEEEEL